MDCKLVKCNCPSEFQDHMYGKGVRVHNPCGKAGTKLEGTKWRCTVCTSTK